MDQTPKTQELFSSHIPALQVLMGVGYTYLSPEDAMHCRGRNSEVLLRDVLVDELKKRRFVWKGKEYPLSTNAIDQIVRELVPTGMGEGLLAANQRIYDMLTLGYTVDEFVDGKKVSPTIPIVDWQDIANNAFHVTDEFEVKRDNPMGEKTRRPDIVCFVNGIPLVVIECKRPDPPNASNDPIKEGISQNIRNQKVGEIPNLFAYSQLLFSVNGIDGRYGTTKTDAKFWSLWREPEHAQDEASSEIERVRNTPLTQQHAALFAQHPPYVADYFDQQLQQGAVTASPQDRLLYSLLRPSRLLEFIRCFILFDQKVGKIAARHQQFFAIRELIKRVSDKGTLGAREGGVIWHTTGSGKSFTMVFMAKALILDEELKACRFFVVTDRTDLEDQLSDVFVTAGALQSKRDIVEARAKTGRDLAKRIATGSERILFSIINKFATATKLQECRNDSSDIIVLIDEGHRSHGGETHERMRQALPNAAYVAFTGTPLLKDDKTTNKFGPIIHAYTMQQAVQDKTVTPLLYEERVPELGTNTKAIDSWFERITDGLTEEQKADLKRKYSAKGQVYQSESRIELIAHDISDHFSKNIPEGMKGQLATDSKVSAIKYKKYLDEIGLITSAVVISAPDTREGHESVDETTLPEVQQWWKDNVAVTGMDDTQWRKEMVRRFDEEVDPQLLIVVDKLLTGFDEPKNMVLYIDKPLKQHNLIQAIARVNRLHEAKKFGLLIDYRGILKELDTAIEAFQDLYERTQGGYDLDDLAGLYQQTSTEYKKLPRLHDALWALFKSVKNKADLEQFRQVLIPRYETDETGDSVDIRQKVREDFFQALRDFSQCLEVALGSASFYEDKSFSEADRDKYKNDLRFFESLRRIARQDSGESIDYSDYEARIKRLIDKHVVGENVREPEGAYLVSDLGKNIGPDTPEEKTRNETDLIRSRVKRTIDQELQGDPYAQKVFSELLEEAIREAEAMFDHPYQQYVLFKNFQEMLEARTIADMPPALGNNPHARAYYGIFRLVIGDETMASSSADVDFVNEAIWIDNVVDKSVAEHSLNPQSIEAAIRKELLPKMFKQMGMDKAKEVIEQVIQVTRLGLAKELG